MNSDNKANRKAKDDNNNLKKKSGVDILVKYS